MKRTFAVILFAVGVLTSDGFAQVPAAFPPSQSPPHYAVIDLGTLYPVFINNNGVVAGYDVSLVSWDEAEFAPSMTFGGSGALWQDGIETLLPFATTSQVSTALGGGPEYCLPAGCFLGGFNDYGVAVGTSIFGFGGGYFGVWDGMGEFEGTAEFYASWTNLAPGFIPSSGNPGTQTLASPPSDLLGISNSGLVVTRTGNIYNSLSDTTPGNLGTPVSLTCMNRLGAVVGTAPVMGSTNVFWQNLGSSPSPTVLPFSWQVAALTDSTTPVFVGWDAGLNEGHIYDTSQSPPVDTTLGPYSPVGISSPADPTQAQVIANYGYSIPYLYYLGTNFTTDSGCSYGTGFLFGQQPPIPGAAPVWMTAPWNLNSCIDAASGWQINQLTGINNFGEIIGVATPQSSSDPTPSGQHGVLLLPFEFISVPTDPTQQPKTLSNIPAIDKSFFESLIEGNGTPDDSGPVPLIGNNASTDPTKAQVTLSGPLSNTTTNSLGLSLTRLSDNTTVTDTLTETAVNSRVFKNGSGNLEVDLLAPINLSTFVVTAQISNSTWGTSVIQDLVDVTSSSYVYKTKSITTSVTFTGPLSGTTADTISIHLVNPSNTTQSRDVSLTETGANTMVFQGSGVTVTFTQYNAFSSTVQDSVILTVNDPTYSISNEPTVVYEEGLNSLVFDSTGAAVTFGDGETDGAYGTPAPPFAPPDIPENYKFKIRMAKGLASGATTSLTLQGLDSSNNQLESVSVEMDQDPNNPNQYISAKTIVAVDGGVASDAVKAAYPNYIFVDPPHFKVTQPEGAGTPILLSDKTTTYVFPAVRWQPAGGSWSNSGNLTDAYVPGSGGSLGTVHPEPSSGAIAFEHDTDVELFAIVREYDAKQQKSRYFCGAADKPANIMVTEGRAGSQKTVPLEDISQAPESISGQPKWYQVGLPPGVHANDNTADAESAIPYADNPISADDGSWSIHVGGTINGKQNWGTIRYKIAVGDAESLGATARQYTEDDCRISDLVMRIVVKGSYPSDSSGLLSWAAATINVPFCEGARKNQVLNFVAIDCAKTAQSAWYHLGHTPWNDAQSADQIVDYAKAGKYVLVMPLTTIYPDTDTTPGHTHWTDMIRPNPGDLVMFHLDGDNNPNHITHTTIFVGPPGGGNFAAGGADETIYASSRPEFNYSVQDKTYSIMYQRVQNAPSSNPVRIAIVRFQ